MHACNAQVLLHYEAFRQEGARVTYKEFDFGHLDFTFAVGSRVQGPSMRAAVLRGIMLHAESIPQVGLVGFIAQRRGRHLTSYRRDAQVKDELRHYVLSRLLLRD